MLLPCLPGPPGHISHLCGVACLSTSQIASPTSSWRCLSLCSPWILVAAGTATLSCALCGARVPLLWLSYSISEVASGTAVGQATWWARLCLQAANGSRDAPSGSAIGLPLPPLLLLAWPRCSHCCSSSGRLGQGQVSQRSVSQWASWWICS